MQATLINILYGYLLLGLLVSAIEALSLVRDKGLEILEDIVFLTMAILAWPYVLYTMLRR